jgi:ABC-type molybdate transport system substrate-binding protein
MHRGDESQVAKDYATRLQHAEVAARAFIDYLASPGAQAIFQKHEFTITAP